MSRLPCTLMALVAIGSCGGGADGGTTPPNPPPVALTGIALSAAAVTLSGIGAGGALSATLAPAGVTSAIVWSTDNPAVATVAASGTSATITATGGGTASVSARAGAFSAQAIVTVTPIVRSVSLLLDTLRLVVGDSNRVVATVARDPGADTAMVWSTGEPSIAAVNTNGVVSAIAPGVTTLRVGLIAFPALIAMRSVVVSSPNAAVTVTPRLASLVTGQAVSLSATVVVASGVSSAVTWSSSAPTIATVNGVGRVTALAPGVAVVRATSVANPLQRDSASITVRAPTVQRIALTPAADTLSIGASRTLQATVVADSGVNTALVWSSSAPLVASVSSAGLVLAIAPGGPVTITARSVAVSSITAMATTLVRAPATHAAFLEQRVGIGASLGGLDAVGMIHPSATSVVAASNRQGQRSSNLFRVDGGVGVDLPSTCCVFGGEPTALAAADQASVLVSYAGDRFSLTSGARVVLRTAVGEQDTNWPQAQGVTTDFVTHLRYNGSGSYLALASSGRIQEYAGGAWSVAGAFDFGGARYQEQAAYMGATELMALACTPANTPLLVRFRHGSANQTLASPPGACASPFNTTLRGRQLSEILAVNANGVHDFDGVTWRTLAPGVIGIDTLRIATTCGADRYAASKRGRVYQLQGASWQLIGEPGEMTALSTLNTFSEIDCAPTGPLRVFSGGGFLARRNGGGWVTENFAPTLAQVHLSSPTSGYAVGDGVVYQWNGATWTRVRQYASPDLRLTGVITTGPGHMLAIGSFRRDPIGTSSVGMLRYDGSSWRMDAIAPFSLLSELVSLGGGQALALPVQAAAAHFNGSSWSTTTGGLSDPRKLAGNGSGHAMAIDFFGGAARFDGSAWTLLPSIPGVFTLPSALYTSSATFAMASSCSGASSRLVRWNGSSWIDTPRGPIPTTLCITSLFGTSPTDVYALTAPRALYRWDGASWSTVSVPSIADVQAGSAVPGAVMLTGFRAFTAVARPPIVP